VKIAVLLRAINDPELAAGVSGTTWRLDDASLVALATALTLRYPGPATVTGVAVGPGEWDAPLREALALGLDEVVRCWSPELAAGDIAAHGAALAAALPSDTVVVVAGGPASDSGSGVLPPLLAGLLDWPVAADVTSVRAAGNVLLVQARAPGGRRLALSCSLPVVIACARQPAPPLLAPVARRLAARRRPVPEVRPPAPAASAQASYRFAGYGPARPLTRRLLKPDATASSGTRLRQLMSGGAGGGAKKAALGGGDIATQVADFLAAEGFVRSA